jgi:ABC-type antimicrobial peptide transport system permease subunit
LGEFSLEAQQGVVRTLFVSLEFLQKELAREGSANTILIAANESESQNEASESSAQLSALKKILNETARLEDFGVSIRRLDALHSLSLETDSKLIGDQLASTANSAAEQLSVETLSVLSYLANSISAGQREIPYSLVTAIEQKAFETLEQASGGKGEAGKRGEGNRGEEGKGERGRGNGGEERTGERAEDAPILPGAQSPSRPEGAVPTLPLSQSPIRQPILLNEWAARDLGVSRGDEISVAYYLWHEDGRLETKTAQFELAGIVPISGLAADRELVPSYPGITESEHLSDWDPPFPVDLSRVRKHDEDYWKQFRTTPKAFIPLDRGQQLWQSRFGKLTSLRVGPVAETDLGGFSDKYRKSLRSRLDPEQMGIRIVPTRAEGLQAARGATDFGEYFLYFSFFLVVSALLLTVLFFKLGVEQRLREIGTLEAMGFPPRRIVGIFVTEGLIVSLVGSVLGLAGAILYGHLLIYGLRTWWVEAVGTTMLALHVRPISLVLGAVGGVLAAVFCIILTLRRLSKVSTRTLLHGTGEEVSGRSDETGKSVRSELDRGRGARLFRRLVNASSLAWLTTVSGLVLLLATALGLMGEVAGFFGAGTLLLVGLLCHQSVWLRRGKERVISGTGWWSVSRLGFRNSTHRPGRSIFCIALIAAAAFLIVAVDSFRRSNSSASDKKSGTGGFSLLAESLLPLVHDPNTTEGREALNLSTDDNPTFTNVTFTRFRVRPGDDASCLNLYRPENPEIISADENFIGSGRFIFQNSLAQTNEEKNNPWLLLNKDFPDGAVPVIGDANSLTYVLHLKVGDTLTLNQSSTPLRLKIVGALSDSVLQDVLVMGERNFLRLFPEIQGYRFFLLDASDPSSTLIGNLEDRLSDYGFDVLPTGERLAQFHRVENTYLSTFQLLGGLGIVLGTLGMAAVLLRNVLERRRELALLRAVGYNSFHFTLMVVAENTFLLFSGLVTGTICALLSVAPVLVGRGAAHTNISLGVVLFLVLISGLAASLVATLAALRTPLLPALKAE